jgi:DNA-directed RNA polymerase sigma subunit (sigma70/sigma32)
MDRTDGDLPEWRWKPIRTFREVADILGTDHSQIRREERRALIKLRALLLAIPDVRELLEESAA